MTSDDSTTPLKRCSKKELCIHPEGVDGWLPASTEYFHRDKTNHDGLYPACKHCKCKAVRLWNAQNPEVMHEASKRWRVHHLSEVIKYRYSRWDKELESCRRWRKGNPEKVRAIARNRRARKRAAEGTHTAADVEAQLKRQKGHCYYCGVKLDKYHVDHVIPLSRGGSNSPDNLVIACPSCNLSKSDKMPHEWGESGRLL